MGAIVQSTVLPFFSIWGLKVELVLLLVASWSMLRGLQEGVVWAIVGGIGLDLFSAAPFGTAVLALAVTSFVVSKIGKGLLRTNALLPIAAAPAATLMFNLVVAGLLEAFGWQVKWSQILSEVILPLCLLNSIAMAPIYGLLYGIHSRTQREINW